MIEGGYCENAVLSEDSKWEKYLSVTYFVKRTAFLNFHFANGPLHIVNTNLFS
jgi:hypothetical protein